MIRVMHARPDGSFVIEHNSLPYHVLPDDPLFEAVSKAAENAPLEPEPMPVRVEMPPSRVSKRALLREMTEAGIITRAEALAAAKTGEIPDRLRAPLLGALDEDAAFDLELAWATVQEMDRASPLWERIIAAGIVPAEKTDEVFAAAARAK